MTIRLLTRTRAVAAITAAGLALSYLVVGASAATADTMPPDPTSPSSPPTVSADALPTTQIDGVAWSQVVVGNTVYVAGKFTTARPAGSAPGANTQPRANLLAYNIETGVLDTTFKPALNGQALGITASPDGSRIYVTGDFTTVDGANYYRIAAFSTATKQVIPSFKPILGSQGRAIAASNSTVYVGGTFRTVSGQARDYFAAINAADGAVKPWAANADSVVDAIAITGDQSKVVAGGRFLSFAGTTGIRGLAAIDAASGAPVRWDASATVRNAGTKASITSLTASGDRVYGTGYVFGENSDGNLEGTFSADPSTGAINWVEDCHGDTYSSYPLGEAVYVASHAHYCGNIGAFPQTEPWTQHYATAFSKQATGTITPDPYGYFNWAGTPSPTLLNWFPKLQQGTYTGQGQAGWNVTGNDKYVVYGGEFPNVNGTAQYGLVRFAVPSIAPNKVAPIVNVPLVPNPISYKRGEVRISWTTTYDYDNANLTYKLVRDNVTANPIFTANKLSNFYTLSQMGFIDKGLVPGSTHTYRLYVTDPYGNSISRLSPTVTVASTDSGGAYADAVTADSPKYFWPLDEASGSVGYDHAGFSDLDAEAGVTRGASGIVGSQTASTFDGSAAGTAATPAAETSPDVFTVESWVRTTSTSGGKIVGFGNMQTGNSNSYDRHVYMDNSGKIWFGVYPGGVRTVNSSASFNDGQWHQVVASLSPAGMVLYVDGKVVGSRTDVTSGQPFNGYWRIGGDNIGGWPSQPASNNIAGDISNVAVYPVALTRTDIVDHFVASGRTSPIPPAPADDYGKRVFDDDPTLFWRLNEANGGAAADSGPLGVGGTYTGSTTGGQSGAVAGTTNKSVLFQSPSAVYSNAVFTNPTTYSAELWFSTTTTVGGKLIGFGNAQEGLSNNYDRHIYMQDDGRLVFGTYTGQLNTITSGNAYNDGQWHHAVATQSNAGMVLFVDGVSVGTNPQTSAQDYSGYWKIGGDPTWGSSSAYFNGKLDEAAVYQTALSATTVADHYRIGKGQAPANTAPTASFTTTEDQLAVTADGTASSDAEGPIAGYAWSWGDGTNDSGATATHAYDQGGTYTVTLTVTDAGGLTGTSTKSITVTAPPVNQAPTAAFTSTVSNLTADFTAAGSNDPDGSIVSWEWAYGDGATGTGETSSHAYATAGTFTVSLTVTDNGGKSSTVTHNVTTTAPPVNQAPAASFTATVSNLSVAFDATASADPDGTISGYAWAFGDGTTGTGATTSHTYATAGSYTATLTVTDNEGATGTTTRTFVTTTAPPAGTDLAKDDFTRNVASGWGTATTGGPWTITGTASALKVADGLGQVTIPGGSTRVATLAGVNATDVDAKVKVSLDAVPVGGDSYTTISTRQVGATYYGANLWVRASGAVYLVLRQGGTVLSTTQVAGLTYTPGLELQVRLRTTGTNPTTVSGKIWRASQTEPAAWLSTVTDSTASLQGPGTVGLRANITGTSAARVTRFDDFLVTGTATTPPANAAPTAAFTSTVNNLTADFNGSTSSDSDGTIAGYAWGFGDGTTGTGATTSHAYATAGTYTVTLTVTDNQGATGTTTRTVVATAPPVPGAELASDDFARTTTTGWGTATTGGAWTIGGNAAALKVADGVGQVSIPGGSTRTATLSGVSATAVDAQVKVSLDALPVGGDSYSTLVGRQVGTGYYAANVWVKASNSTVFLVLRQGAAVLSSVQVAGLTYTPGTALQVRLQVTGTSPTTIRAKIWNAAQPEPTAWLSTVTDATAALQTAGAVGVQSSFSGGSTTPLITRYDDFIVRPTP
jgi:PKD repeat protein